MNYENKVLKSRETIRTIFFILIILSAFAFLLNMPRLTIPVGISYVLFLVINPIIPTLIKLKLSRGSAVAIVFVVFIIISILPMLKIVPLVIEESENFQYYIPQIEKVTWSTYRSATTLIEQKTGYTVSEKHLSDLIFLIKEFSKNILKNIPNALASLIEWIFIIPLILFFMLKDGVTFKKIVLKITPNSFFERFYYLFHQLNKKFGGYLFAKFIEASIVGFIITSGLFLAGIKFSLLFGFLAAITNIIPYVGPILGAIPALIWGFTEYGVSTSSIFILILFLVANVIDLALVFPLLVSKIVDMHPIIVVISVILGSQFLGLTGMIISIPLAAAFKLLFIEIFNGLYPGQR